jgi:uncharacterized membrane protein YidH (DUF202 family)
VNDDAGPPGSGSASSGSGPSGSGSSPAAELSADERTDLAWNRSGLAIIACGIVVGRGLTLNHFERSDVAVGAVILGLGVASYLLAAWHARRRLAPGRMVTVARRSDLLPLAIGVTIIGVSAFLLGLLFPA